MMIRQAKVADVVYIHALIKEHSLQGELLPRPITDLYEKLPEFVVVESKGVIVGCGALHVSWEDLAEVRSLVIAKECQGAGIGSKIVKVLEKRAAVLGITRVFALSFKPGFFKVIGYKEISKDELPQKVWRDCVNCHLFPDCGETALIKIKAGK